MFTLANLHDRRRESARRPARYFTGHHARVLRHHLSSGGHGWTLLVSDLPANEISICRPASSTSIVALVLVLVVVVVMANQPCKSGHSRGCAPVARHTRPRNRRTDEEQTDSVNNSSSFRPCARARALLRPARPARNNRVAVARCRCPPSLFLFSTLSFFVFTSLLLEFIVR